MRILIIQCGDYREAYYRFYKGGPETYYAQRFSIEYVAKLTEKCEYVGVLFTRSAELYQELLPNGVTTIGINYPKDTNIKEFIKIIAKQAPTHIILQTPIREIINWACNSSIKILPLFADSFERNEIKKWLFNYRLRHALNKNCVAWVANHNIGASISLIKIGVNPNKVLPWDWPTQMSPEQYKIREHKQKFNDYVSLIYIGVVNEEKGVGDTISAVKYIKDKCIDVRLDIYGDGEIDKYTHIIKNNKLGNEVILHGKISHQEIINEILSHDMIIVPSRHSYPEGLPNVINEGLCTRTPLVVSDHPMFISRLRHKKNAMIFKAGDEIDMAKNILELKNNHFLYNSLSQNAEETWNKLQIKLKWNELIDSWLEDGTRENKFLNKHIIETYEY